jgi:coenzyme F420 hydrogenase subunit beta
MSRNDNSVKRIPENDLCTGCGTCASLCPSKAIVIEIDKENHIYKPKINYDLCKNCGICNSVCPGKKIDYIELNDKIFGKQPSDFFLGNYINCYIGYCKDEQIRFESTSGGLVTSMLIYALDNKLIDGALVTRMNPENPLEPEPFIARTEKEIMSASKSKYCPVPLNVLLSSIADADDGERFAVVGLPCHVHGIRKAQAINPKLKKNIVLLLGLFCAHTDSFLATYFILNKLKIMPTSVKSMEYRGNGWPGYMSIIKTNGKVVRIAFNKYIPFHHSCNFFTPKRCLFCADATCELSDLSLGDAWNFPTQDDNYGNSIVVSRSSTGEMVLSKMINEKYLTLKNINPKQIIFSQKGLFYSKKIALRFRLSILRLFGKEIPLIDSKFPDFGIFFPMDAILPYINSCIGSRSFFLYMMGTYPLLVLYYGSVSSLFSSLWLKQWLLFNRSGK